MIEDATRLTTDEWNHTSLPFDRGEARARRSAGDDAPNPWHFRKLVGYIIRSQGDYLDVFQLGKFSGKHQDWKPFVGHLLGLDAQPIIDLYAKREQHAAAD